MKDEEYICRDCLKGGLSLSFSIIAIINMNIYFRSNFLFLYFTCLSFKNSLFFCDIMDILVI